MFKLFVICKTGQKFVHKYVSHGLKKLPFLTICDFEINTIFTIFRYASISISYSLLCDYIVTFSCNNIVTFSCNDILGHLFL